MSELFGGKPLHVSVRHHDGSEPDVVIRWESPDGADVAAIERLVAADPSRFLVTDPGLAVELVNRIRSCRDYLQMTSQIALLGGEAVGYVQLMQVLVGDRTHLLLVGITVAPDAPAGTGDKLFSTVLHTARAGFYSVLLTTLPPGSIPGIALEPAEDHAITGPPGLFAGRLYVGSLIPYGLDDRPAAVLLDDAVAGVLAQAAGQDDQGR